jgi:hypothetical protein
MHSEGDVVRISDLDDPGSGRIARLLRTVKNLMVQQPVKQEEILENTLVLVPLLKVLLFVLTFNHLYLGEEFSVYYISMWLIEISLCDV